MTDSQQTNLNHLYWRCRRGVKELDVIFTRFVETDYLDLSEEQKKAFEKILETQDPIIMDWLFGRSEPTNKIIKQLINKLKQP